MNLELPKIIESIEDLKSEELKQRLNAVSQIGNIARAFGPDRTRQLLIPFLKEYEDDEEEILLELCKQLPQVARVLTDKDTSLPELINQFTAVLNYEDFSVINEVRSLGHSQPGSDCQGGQPETRVPVQFDQATVHHRQLQSDHFSRQVVLHVHPVDATQVHQRHRQNRHRVRLSQVERCAFRNSSGSEGTAGGRVDVGVVSTGWAEKAGQGPTKLSPGNGVPKSLLRHPLQTVLSVSRFAVDYRLFGNTQLANSLRVRQTRTRHTGVVGGQAQEARRGSLVQVPRRL